MTLLASWIGVDTHGTSSAYIAADSRISWDGRNVFDHGRKVFVFKKSPDIIGYCGDVLFPSIVLGQIVEMSDCGLLFPADANSKVRFECIKEALVQQFRSYPYMVKEIAAESLQVLHISRDSIDSTRFSCCLIGWHRSRGWSGKEYSMPFNSGILKVLGSGSFEFDANLARYWHGPDCGTSRAIFHCFCDALINSKDPYSGGAPQLVGIYRKPGSVGNAYGIIMGRKRYFLGAFVGKHAAYHGVEWRNDLFERCDGETMKRIDGSQRQPDTLRRFKK